jgi:hypothetical protein
MADYLRFGGVETDSEGDGKSLHSGLRTLSRKTKELIGRATQLKTELHALGGPIQNVPSMSGAT